TPENDVEICDGVAFPMLSVSTAESDLTVNWYDAPSGGNLVQSNSAIFQPERAGTYFVELVNEVNNCRSNRAPISLIINELPELVTLEASDISCNDAFGAIQVSGTGDHAPFEYALNNGAFGSNNSFTNLSEGNYQVSIRNVKGCVSKFDTEIKVEQRFDEQSITQYTCNTEEVGMETIRLTNSLGCDSIITIITLDGSSEPTNVSATTCDPNQAATETLTLTNEYGCDSLVITSYTLIPADTSYVDLVSCDPDDVGERMLALENQFGCDSIVIIRVSYAEENRIFLEATSCNPEDVGIDTSYYTNQFGCDSIVVMETKLQGTGHSELTFFRKMTCDFGKLGLDTTHYQNQYGCDSIVIIERYFGFPPPPQLNITRDQRICRGDTVFLSSDSYDYNLQWLKNGEEIAGENSNSLYITEGGGYAISHFNDEGCVVVSDVVEIMIKDTPPDPVFSNTNNFLQLETEVDTQMVSYQWYLDDEIIEDANSDNYCAKASGIYMVVATNQTTGCSSSFSLNVLHDPDIAACLVSAEEVYEQVQLQVYPNPHMDEFWINYDLKHAATVEVKIFDLVGKVHYRQREKSASMKFNHSIVTKGWAKGVYLLQVNIDGVNYLHKIVKGK
ncbi:MAG: T9SS type A sorting domain-containing protein, partial [Bacteroidota bacterium]